MGILILFTLQYNLRPVGLSVVILSLFVFSVYVGGLEWLLFCIIYLQNINIVSKQFETRGLYHAHAQNVDGEIRRRTF